MVNCKIFSSQSGKSGEPTVKYFTLKTRVKYFTKVTQSSLPTLSTLCFLNIKVPLPQTRPPPIYSPATNPLIGATHHHRHQHHPLIHYEARTRLGGCRTGVRRGPTRLLARRCRVWSFFFFIGFVPTRLQFVLIWPKSSCIGRIESYWPETETVETNWNKPKSAMNHTDEDSPDSRYEVKILKE